MHGRLNWIGKGHHRLLCILECHLCKTSTVYVSVNQFIKIHTGAFSFCKKVKLSHIRYRALGPELNPVHRQSAHSWLLKSYPPGLSSPTQLKNVTILWLVGRYTAWCQSHIGVKCEQLGQGCYAALHWWELNPQHIDRKSNTIPLRHCATSFCTMWSVYGIGVKGKHMECLLFAQPSREQKTWSNANSATNIIWSKK